MTSGQARQAASERGGGRLKCEVSMENGCEGQHKVQYELATMANTKTLLQDLAQRKKHDEKDCHSK